MKTYSKRVWLNANDSYSTGAVVAYNGFVTCEGKEEKVAFLEISSCFDKARLHKTSKDTMTDFREKMELLRSTIDDFIENLKEEC